MKLFKNIFVFIAICLHCLCAYANNLPRTNDRIAASPSFADVSAAIASADPGDIVLVPAGLATWNSPLIITKGIILKGAGAGSTVITSNCGSGDFLINYTPSDFASNHPFRVSGFTLNLNDVSHGILLNHANSKSLVIQTKIRIDHNTITNTGSTYTHQAIWNNGMRGVVDNNAFTGFRYPVRNPACPGTSLWWDNWEAVVYGKVDNNMYFEDNIFTGVEILMDCQYSNRYVVRYNTITTITASWPFMDMHGNAPGGMMWSGFGGEVYGNQINAPFDMRLMDHRGGKMLIFMNNKDGAGNWGIQVRDEYADSVNPSINPSPQYPNDSYYFLNRKNLTGSFPTIGLGQYCDNFPLAPYPSPTENREFWNGTDSFDGTVGCGYGTLANRPATCTVGVGYWATDQSTTDLTGMVGNNPTTPIVGALYKCTSTNVWTAFYTPYTYPHPLRTLLSY